MGAWSDLQHQKNKLTKTEKENLHRRATVCDSNLLHTRHAGLPWYNYVCM